MPLPLPNLDDRTFEDLVSELRSLIPRYDKTWTNHNTSDPGITLLELFAWLAEMVMYRMNRIEDRTYRTFLKLMGVQPSGPQAEITFEIRLPQAALSAPFAIPQGTRIAARDEKTGDEIVFETTAEVPFSEDNWDQDLGLWVFKAAAINTLVITEASLGFSDGSPKQEFPLQGPLFLDQSHEAYGGNPVVYVGEVQPENLWTYKSDLLTSTADDQHFTAEPLEGLIQFGDGVLGKIPAAGSRIICTYRRMGGKSGNVAAEKIATLKDALPGIPASKISVFNEYPASGGVDSESLDDLLARGLAMLQEPYRAVSDEDFAYLAKQAAPDKVARVKVLANRNLEGTTPLEEGHVSLIILPVRAYLGLAADPAKVNPATQKVTSNRSSAIMAGALSSPNVNRLNKLISRFLDERRLITTIVHVVEPQFTSLRLELTLQAKAGVNPPELIQAVVAAVAGFLDPYGGWQDHQGWPFARDVYRSELYQQIEAVQGVDHVVKMSMNDDATTSLVTVQENRLVSLDELVVTVL